MSSDDTACWRAVVGRGDLDQPGLPGQHRDGEDVVDVLGHRHDVGVQGLLAVGLLDLPDAVEDLEGLAEAVVADLLPVPPRGERAPAGQLLRQRLDPPAVVELAVRGLQLAEPVEERRERGVVEVGVLADVDAGEVQPDGVGGAHDVAQHPVGDPLALVGAQRAVHHLEVAQVLLGAEVVPPRHVGGAVDVAVAGVLEPGVDVGALEPVGLLGVEPDEPVVDLGEVAPVAGEPAAQVLGHPDEPRGDRELLHEVLDQAELDAHAPLGVDPHGLRGQLGGDVGVAVPVAAHPGAQHQRAGPVGQRQPDPRQLLVQHRQHLGHGVVPELLEVVRRGTGLVEHRRALGADLVGLPDEVDEPVQLRLLDLVGEVLGQDVGDPAQLAEHRLALGLGRVRGEHRLELEAGEGGGQLVGVGLGGEPVGELVDRAVAVLVAGPALRGAVGLLGEVGQVEVGREGAGEHGGRARIEVGEQVADLVVALLRHLADQPADLLDELEHLVAVLPGEGPAQQGGEPSDVTAQRRVLRFGGDAALGGHGVGAGGTAAGAHGGRLLGPRGSGRPRHRGRARLCPGRPPLHTCRTYGVHPCARAARNARSVALPASRRASDAASAASSSRPARRRNSARADAR